MSSPTFVARGTITRPAGAKLAEIMLRSADNHDVQPVARELGGDGRFEFRSLLPGSYTISMIVVDLSVLQNPQPGTTPQMQFFYHCLRFAGPWVRVSTERPSDHASPHTLDADRTGYEGPRHPCYESFCPSPTPIAAHPARC